MIYQQYAKLFKQLRRFVPPPSLYLEVCGATIIPNRAPHSTQHQCIQVFIQPVFKAENLDPSGKQYVSFETALGDAVLVTEVGGWLGKRPLLAAPLPSLLHWNRREVR